MQKVSRIAVVNLGGFRVAFRVLVKGGKDTDFSSIFLAGKHKVIDLRDRGIKKGTEVQPEIDVTPIREAGQAGKTKGRALEYDPNGGVATFLAKGTSLRRRLELIE